MEEEKEGNILRRKIFGPRWRRKTERVKGEIIWRKKIFGLRRRRKAEKEKGGNNLRRDIIAWSPLGASPLISVTWDRRLRGSGTSPTESPDFARETTQARKSREM